MNDFGLSPLLRLVGINRQGLDLSELRSRAKEEAHRKESEQFKATVQSTRISPAQPQRSKKSPLKLDRNQLSGTSRTRKDSSPVKVCVDCIVITERG